MPVSRTACSSAPRKPDASSGPAVVAISAGGRNQGLYRVRRVEARTMIIGHGAISFPVGMNLEVKDYQDPASNATPFSQRATVVENGSDGIRLAW